jgi:sulfate permease, SulP family
MTALDATGLHALEALAKRLRQSGRTLLLCGARDQPARLLEQAEFVEHIGRQNVLPHVEAALERARQINAEFGGVGQEMAEDFQKTIL